MHGCAIKYTHPLAARLRSPTEGGRWAVPQASAAADDGRLDIGAEVCQAFNYPYFPRFFPIFSRFPWTCGRVPWIPGVQTLKMGERWGKMGKTMGKKRDYGGSEDSPDACFGGLGKPASGHDARTGS